MKRTTKILAEFGLLAIVLFVALFVAAYFTPKHNKIAIWRVNLMGIVEAKQLWAGNQANDTNDTPTFEELRPYLSDWVTNHISWTNGQLVDVDGGIYAIGHVGEGPSCLIGGVRRSLQ
ncbi:MAG TPA: hypothetical protein VK742_04050 [Candidatus Sulfotelmatobacter sp.]|jgi:hypothetical protein|nr:hypothetical protein [Candidatus Sulfotelmatobacter sp.]